MVCCARAASGHTVAAPRSRPNFRRLTIRNSRVPARRYQYQARRTEPRRAMTSSRVNPLLHEKLPYGPVRDVAPISLAVDDFLSIVAASTLPINSLAEFVAYARTRPRELNFYGVAGSPYLAYLAFQKRAGIAI